MLLSKARVNLFRSITDSGEVLIDSHVTVLVGQNESGKTAFLQALHRAQSVEKSVSFDVTEDYPRKHLTSYQKKHEAKPDRVVELTYKLEDEEVNKINRFFGCKIITDGLEFTNYHDYKGNHSVGLHIADRPYIQHQIAKASLPSNLTEACASIETVSKLINFLRDSDLNLEGKTFLAGLEQTFEGLSAGWKGIDYVVYQKFCRPNLPKFLYFDDYSLLPGKLNLLEYQQHIEKAKGTPSAMDAGERTMMGLFEMADITIEELTSPSGYETIKAKLESISNSITDKIFEYWKQNQELDVSFDIRADSNDRPPYNNGNNLYIRIWNRRHRMSVPFSQRSKGFIWFFSFIVWFENIKRQLGTEADLVLLLDEPGLSLHALAQADLLRYIDELSNSHQVCYTTHSPFMVQSDKLDRVRAVEDKVAEGTKITSNISGSDAKTIFPLQAALGYTIAQNLFISKRNLLVEGPADLIYLQYFSNLMRLKAREPLREDVTIVPTGGLDKIATFIALLRGNQLEAAVLHDYNKRPDPHLDNIVREKLIREKSILNYSLYRGAAPQFRSKTPGLASDVEDMVSPTLYMKLFNAAYAKELSGIVIKESDLPQHDRIVERINQYLQTNSIVLRKSGGFNHYLVASHLASNPPKPSTIDKTSLDQFEALFKAVNGLYSD